MTSNDFFTSGFSFNNSQRDNRSKYQMMNIAIVLSSSGLIFGMASNYYKDIHALIPLEMFLLSVNIILFFVLRKDRKYFMSVATIVTAQFTFLFLYLIYITQPNELKHIWLFTYPIILLYFQDKTKGVYWVSFIIGMLLIAPLQPFIEVSYSFFQVVYLTFVLLIVSLIIFFYQKKMDEAKGLILEQQNMLLGFNAKLERQVEEKTATLLELNESLEVKVEQKVQELIQKDKILTTQSKQAVMGEMISMIAHQWRQPLSTITLYITNLKVKRLLGEKVSEEDTYKTLDEISDMIIYLSETIDDFKRFFHPNKELEEIDIYKLLDKAISFTTPRLKETHIEVVIKKDEAIIINTYTNELIQVILNLLNNAIDVLVTMQSKSPKITLSVKSKDADVFIYVEDNGTGIAKENITRVFEPYFSTKGKNGTGLGLYMSQMILQKQFNGNIDVQTSKDGSIFIIEIPKDIE
jgi:C4-dicarboxylate-specific signal transduction histidine kinase